jgi:hypothetical protein
MTRSWSVVPGLSIFVLVLLAAWRSRRAVGVRGFPLRGPWAWQDAAACCGVLAALLFALMPNWSYGHAVEALVTTDARPAQWGRQLPALAMFAGVSVSALLVGRFRLVRPAWVRSLRCLSGGAVMAYGASCIPGGNDALLLWSIPGLTVYGLIAYAVMLLALMAAFGAGRYAKLR